jgi:hypothetical protein
MNTTGLPEGFIADPEWLQSIAMACRHTVGLIHATYGDSPENMSMEEIAQLNIASAYLYLYDTTNLTDIIPEDVVWH